MKCKPLVPMQTEHYITIHPLEIDAHSINVSWEVTPETELYKRTSFSLEFPEKINVKEVPEYLLWIAVISCLHSHWIFLRPCKVIFPVEFQDGFLEFWRRMLKIQIDTFDTYRNKGFKDGGIELQGGRALVELPEPLPLNELCATAFSGGKDSLVQTGLLSELTEKPLLVTTTSARDKTFDHQAKRRRFVLEEIVKRKDVSLVEVKSDFRSSCVNGYFWKEYTVAINEVADTHLYEASLMIAAYALGYTHLFLASETEVQANAEIEGRVVCHPHMMYSTTLQRSISALLEPLGLCYSSMISSLHSCHVQELLWKRYPDISDLQYSCWMVKEDESACNKCSECLRLGLCCLSLGMNPEVMGMNLLRMFTFAGTFKPRVYGDSEILTSPRDITRKDLHSQLIRFVQNVSMSKAAKFLFDGKFKRYFMLSYYRALLDYRRLRKRCLKAKVGQSPGYRSGFFTQVDPFMVEKLKKIYTAYFSEEPEELHKDTVGRSERLIRHITKPLAEIL